MKITYAHLALNTLYPGRFQPRLDFNEKALEELADSIRQQGVIEPVIVRACITENTYEIIAGERRVRAARMAKLHTIPCLIGQYSDAQAAALTVVENVQRESLNLIEEAHGYKRLIDEFAYSQDSIATLTGKSRSHIANIVRLLSLKPDIQKHIAQGLLTLGHARMLVGLPDSEQSSLAHAVITRHWSVRALEDKIRQHKMTVHTLKPLTCDTDIQHLEQALTEYFATPVSIVPQKNTGGYLQIQYFDNDTLEGLLNRMGFRYDGV